MLSKDTIENNFNTFIDLIKSINRKGFDKDGLIEFLSNSDFKVAPASTIYHGSYEGGLVEHLLQTYKALFEISNVLYTNILDYPFSKYDDNSLKIVGLLHDLEKVNKYEKYNKPKKVYCENGSKFDDGGRFEWKNDSLYRTSDSESRLILGNHEQNCLYLIERYIPLSVEEAAAILHHHGGKGYDSSLTDVSTIYNKYNLATLLHIADLTSTYILQNND